MTTEASDPAGPPESGEVIVVLTLRFKPRTVEKVLDGVLPAIGPTRAESGNNRFEVYRVSGSEDTLVIFERWKSKADLENHWGLSYAQTAVDLFAEHLIEPIQNGKNVLYLSECAART